MHSITNYPSNTYNWNFTTLEEKKIGIDQNEEDHVTIRPNLASNEV